MLIIKKQTSVTNLSIKHLGYQYDTSRSLLVLPKGELYTITDNFLDTYTVDTRDSNVFESNYLILETNLFTDYLDLEISYNNTLYTVPVRHEQQTYSDFIVKFYPIKDNSNYVVVIKNTSTVPSTLKIDKRFIKLFGNHINNADGQIVGASLLIDTTLHQNRNCYLKNINKVDLLDRVSKLKQKLVTTFEDNYHVFTLTQNVVEGT